ncbi:MAG: beta-lactamase family protein [Flavobacteriales bacterium]|nr:beta-lactamase family protein [Flavobacteriales bacterium]
MVTKLKLSLLLLAFIVPGTILAQFTDELESIQMEHDIMGITISTVCNGSLDSTYHIGLANWENQTPITDQTQFRIASISKLVSAIGLMTLWEDNLFDLDDDISTYLGYEVRNPDYPDTPITIRMVLSHQSSIQDGDGYFDFLNGTYGTSTPPSIFELLDESGDYHTPNVYRLEQPGTHFAYSNLNYGIVGTLVEAISDQRFDEYMRDEVLVPLGMDAGYNVNHLEDINTLGVIYRKPAGWVPQVDNYEGVYPGVGLVDYENGTNGSYFAPQGGLRASAKDLAQIIMLLQGARPDVLLGTTAEMMMDEEWLYNGSNGDNYFNLFNSWGLGVHRITNTSFGDVVFPDIPVFGHAGEAYGLVSDLYVMEGSNGFGFSVMINGCGNGYEFGETSSFYQPEEQIFNAIETHLLPNCTASSVNDVQSELPYSFIQNEEKTVLIAKNQCSLELMDSLGRIVAQKSLNPGEELDLTSFNSISLLKLNFSDGQIHVEKLH